MPGDTPYLNGNAKVQNTYDAIVIGSGISGGWAAKELCEKGLKVLLLERGRPLTHPDYPRANDDPWQFAHRFGLTVKDKRLFPVQSRHWSLREDNKHYYINDVENTYEEVNRFDWIRGDIVGGRSILWSRACYRWSDLDFEANLRDGHGIDWPIRYKDLAPWYDYVEKFVGVSGNRDGVPQLPDGVFQPPFEMNIVEKEFKKKVEAQFPDRKVIIGRTANLTQPIEGRGLCQARNMCHRGCTYGAYFSSNSATLPAAFATGNLTMVSGAIVNKIIYDEKLNKATGVEVIDRDTKEMREYFARIIFVNASTVATAAILLNSTSRRFPQGLGNDSGQLGKNLMDHHKGLSVTARWEGFEEWYYKGRRPAPIYIPRFRNVGRQDSSFLRGYHLAGGANRSRGNTSEGVGSQLKKDLSEAGPWHVNLYAFGECLPYEDNKVLLDKERKDSWGRPLIRIDCTFRENERNMNRDMGESAVEIMEKTGGKDIRITNNISFPGNSNHEMGTARMGRDPGKSVLNAFNQVHAVHNVFVADGSCMVSGSCVNPSLTYMALTARACDHAVKLLKRGEI
jgi:choline dehydrogenase-like flavoprotein